MPRTKGATNLANRVGPGLPSPFGLTSVKAAVRVPAAASDADQGGPAEPVSWQWVINFLAPILGILVPAISTALRDLVTKGLNDWNQTAKSTPNPWDNFLVEFIAAILKIDLV